jgi:hypothetical protein
MGIMREKTLAEALADDRWVDCLYDVDDTCQHLVCQDAEPLEDAVIEPSINPVD